MSTAAATLNEAVFELLDDLVGPVDVDETLARDRQVDVILTSAVDHALQSIRSGRPGYALFQLEAARFRAQRVLDGTVPDGSTR